MDKKLKVVAALIKKKDKILVCQRKENDVFGLKWEFPGGKIKKGETLKQAIKREIREELGIEIRTKRLMHIFEDRMGIFKIKVYLFECQRIKGTLRALDCKCFKFLELTRAKRLNLAPVDQKILTYLKSLY